MNTVEIRTDNASTTGATAAFGPAVWLARLAIRAYQLSLSAFIGRSCRYEPTCSYYADEAVARYGVWRGGWMAVARFARCGPWGGHGFDPVPTSPPRRARWFLPWRYGVWKQPRNIEGGVPRQ